MVFRNGGKMDYNRPKINIADLELVKNLEDLSKELGVTTQDLSEIRKTFGQEYKSSIWDMEKYLEGTNEVFG